jgi:hypothetical protein
MSLVPTIRVRHVIDRNLLAGGIEPRQFSLELSESKVCLPCEVILERIKLYEVHRKPWGLIGSPTYVFDPPTWCGVARTLCVRGVETPFLGGEAP